MSRNAKLSSRSVERRGTTRQPTALLAFALHPDGTRFPCQVRNISDRGAMLEFLGSHAPVVENAFDLVLTDAKVRYAVKVVWRKEKTAGVLFCLEE
ncbi:PilZ domain-containing protein [Methylobacterium phyllostachyos]|uniref:PilZ domain-containing protein n=1 Tax=Methylobacterium phyllostachyos TaxID=582672 RepID=A0A1G9YZC0_9HYPH|nr:PilZ domain-containing protein [Methylobacterium phyllostachyos]SDN14277.1 PilZ domain-containing protein [Methylobacterium phyllostachyos]